MHNFYFSTHKSLSLSLSLSIYIYIYIYFPSIFGIYIFFNIYIFSILILFYLFIFLYFLLFLFLSSYYKIVILPSYSLHNFYFSTHKSLSLSLSLYIYIYFFFLQFLVYIFNFSVTGWPSKHTDAVLKAPPNALQKSVLDY